MIVSILVIQVRGLYMPYAYMSICIICIGVVRVVSQYDCVYYCDTGTRTLYAYMPICIICIGVVRCRCS
jgi:hypothetical protein